MTSTWIVGALYILIVAALGLVVWWEYQRIRNRVVSRPAADPEARQRENSLPVD